MEKYRTVGLKCFRLLNPRLLKEWLKTLGNTLIGFIVEGKVRSQIPLSCLCGKYKATLEKGGGQAGLALSKEGMQLSIFFAVDCFIRFRDQQFGPENVRKKVK